MEKYLQWNLEIEKQLKADPASVNKADLKKRWKCEFCGKRAVDLVCDLHVESIIHSIQTDGKSMKEEKQFRLLEKRLHDVKKTDVFETEQRSRMLQEDEKYWRRYVERRDGTIINDGKKLSRIGAEMMSKPTNIRTRQV